MDPALKTKVILAAAVGGGCMVTTALLVLGLLVCRRKLRERKRLRRKMDVGSQCPAPGDLTGPGMPEGGPPNDLSYDAIMEETQSDVSGSYMPIGTTSMHSSQSCDTGYSKSIIHTGMNTLEPLTSCHPLHMHNEPFHFPAQVSAKSHLGQTYSPSVSTVGGSHPAVTAFRETLLPANAHVHYSQEGHVSHYDNSEDYNHRAVLNRVETSRSDLESSRSNHDADDMRINVYRAYRNSDSLSDTIQDYDENHHSLQWEYKRDRGYENLLGPSREMEQTDAEWNYKTEPTRKNKHSAMNEEPIVCLNPHDRNQFSITYSTPSSSTSYDNNPPREQLTSH